MTDYPEHSRLAKVRVEFDCLIEFIEGSGYILAEYEDEKENPMSSLVPANKVASDIVMEFLGINPFKIEDERRAMLKELQDQYDKD